MKKTVEQEELASQLGCWNDVLAEAPKLRSGDTVTFENVGVWGR